MDNDYALPLGGVSYGDYVYAGGGARRTTRVRFALNVDGTLRSAQLDQSSGDVAFDAACLRTVSDAAHFPVSPPGVRDDRLVFAVPISKR